EEKPEQQTNVNFRMESVCFAGHFGFIQCNCCQRKSCFTALPRFFPVLCCKRKIILPALSAFSRHLSGCAFQHRVLCLVYDDGCPGLRTWLRRFYSYFRRCTYLQ